MIPICPALLLWKAGPFFYLFFNVEIYLNNQITNLYFFYKNWCPNIVGQLVPWRWGTSTPPWPPSASAPQWRPAAAGRS